MHGPPGEIFPIYIYIYCGEISYILFINSSIFPIKKYRPGLYMDYG